MAGGLNGSNIHRKIKFARLLPEEEEVVTLSPQWTWSHFLQSAVQRTRGLALSKDDAP